jgi:hypothetical protein
METTMIPEIKKLDRPEKTRTYTFPNGQLVHLCNVTAIGVSERGTHRLETADGKYHIVPPGWLHIEFEADGWSI